MGVALRFKTFKRRIGITGISNSGKTVFLTSLINHLKDHDPEFFRIGSSGDISIEQFTSIKNEDEHQRKQFNYDLYRDTLVNKLNWPEKTTDSSYYNCSFVRSDWGSTKSVLEFFDFPGERMADFKIFEKSDFIEWSEYILKDLADFKDTRELASCYLSYIKKDKIDESGLIDNYKRALGKLFLGYKPVISPTTFQLSKNGSVIETMDLNEIVKTRHCGLDESSQFTPIPTEMAEDYPQIAAKFSENYRRYRKEVVMPLFSYLKECHRLIVLIDVPTLLAAGSVMYNDSQKMLKQLFEVLGPGSTMFDKFLKTFAELFIPKWYPAGITRVAFACAKGDMIHPLDRDNLRMLLMQMVRKIPGYYEGLKAEYFVMSSVVSTSTKNMKKRMMMGHPVFDEQGEIMKPGEQKKEFEVSKIPEKWPTSWKEGEFFFTEVYPDISEKWDAPPKQFGMASLFDFLMKEDFAE